MPRGLHRPTRRCGLRSRMTPLSVQATASMEQVKYICHVREAAGIAGRIKWSWIVGIYTRDEYGGKILRKGKGV